jgi:ABC-type transport system substrate-binding protein
MVRIARKSGCDKTVRGCSIYREWIAYFLGALAGGPTQLWFIAPESKAEEGKVSHPIGTGPFEFVEYKTGDHIRFKKFKEYWEKGLPYVDEVLLKPIPDDIVRLTAVRSGDIDIAYRIPIGHAVELLKAP